MRTKAIDGFENYIIREDGLVTNTDTGHSTFGSNSGRYTLICLRKGGKQYRKYAHRLLAEAFMPNPDGKRTVNHINGDKSDNRLENLEWATHSENQKHAYKEGLKVPARGAAKITEGCAQMIKDLINAGMAQKLVAMLVGLDPSSVSKIANGRQWTG